MLIAQKVAVVLIIFLLAAHNAALAEPAARAIVIAHRGASGYRPEHTTAAYELAIDMGADFIEPDIGATKDGELVIRHENEISGTTDVANHPEFADRHTTKTIDGASTNGWFTEDFTLAELKTLRARERMPELRQHNTLYNGRYTVLTLQEVIDIAKRKSAELHREIGVYPEIKHPTYFASIGLSLEKPLVDVLHRNGYRERSAPVFIQCFEVSALKRLKKITALRLILLLDESARPFDLVAQNDPRSSVDLTTPAGLAEIAGYAHGIGPSKNMLIPRDTTGKLQEPTSLVSDAHKAGLLVHPWTFRNENFFLPLDFRSGDANDPASAGQYGNAFAEYKLFYDLGVDGVFSENPDTALEARATK